ncbi:MAG TPA: DUF2071 domain-containing protein [Gemmatimonadaceae bacterium]
MERALLTAEWRCLAILNYRVPPSLLAPLVPRGTELDKWNDATYVSLVGFLFDRTRLLGVRVPFHTRFEEVNLRFYVRRNVGSAVRRGVTFVRELVPRHAVSAVARLAYSEPYRTVPMRHAFGIIGPSGRPLLVEYAWKTSAGWSRLRLGPAGAGGRPERGSEEEFITHRNWGYTKLSGGKTAEYEVRHPLWRVAPASQVILEGDLASVYGNAFANVLTGPPHSAMFANGSPVSVSSPVVLNGQATETPRETPVSV